MKRPVTVVLLAALAIFAVPTLASAAQPSLTATVIPGQEIDVVGAAFPPDADVLLAIERNGADAGSQALHTDSAGSFTATIDAGPGRGGVYTVTATSGSATATVEALAVETAGGFQSTPPPTDTVSISRGRPASSAGDALALLALVSACGSSLLIARLRRRARETVVASDSR